MGQRVPNLNRPKILRRNETRELTHPIQAALNKMDGVRVWRNNSGMLKDHRGVPLRYGMGNGSADLIGCVRVGGVGRYFALEVKRPGQVPTTDQYAWMATVRLLGGFACVVHSVEEAAKAVLRCRAWEHE